MNILQKTNIFVNLLYNITHKFSFGYNESVQSNKWQTVDFNEITIELIGNYERDLEYWADGDTEKLKYIDKWNKVKIRYGEELIYKYL